ncbi:hypothetical protein [Gordonia desulfuricans]|uniref:hypothetical protein n=1 Tax=Gordonia desulfuricans TaxID=89051 RepID=UPI001FD30973|nr:hypothetical protein [Gordonia desulfuricans]
MLTRDCAVGSMFQRAFHHRRRPDPLHPRSDGGRESHLDQQRDRFVAVPLCQTQPVEVTSAGGGERVDEVAYGDQVLHVREDDLPGRIVVETTIGEYVDHGIQLPLHVFHCSERIGDDSPNSQVDQYLWIDCENRSPWGFGFTCGMVGDIVSCGDFDSGPRSSGSVPAQSS